MSATRVFKDVSRAVESAEIYRSDAVLSFQMFPNILDVPNIFRFSSMFIFSNTFYIFPTFLDSPNVFRFSPTFLVKGWSVWCWLCSGVGLCSVLARAIHVECFRVPSRVWAVRVE